ncbi:MAG: hypothetical protein KBG11_04935 [Bacteroidia bacterium]|nr:hypothetical protein [Bacteroidia bacterium]
MLVSCRQTNQEFTLQNSSLVDLKVPICISKQNCFGFSGDSTLSYLKLYLTNTTGEIIMLLDSVEFSPYKSTLHSFKSQKSNSWVILWETEYEYIPVIKAYYFAPEKLAKIGELEIALPCDSCESLDYPINDIVIFKKDKEIEISFRSDVNYKANGSNNWTSFKTGTFKYLFNTETNELIHIILPK